MTVLGTNTPKKKNHFFFFPSEDTCMFAKQLSLNLEGQGSRSPHLALSHQASAQSSWQQSGHAGNVCHTEVTREALSWREGCRRPQGPSGNASKPHIQPPHLHTASLLQCPCMRRETGLWSFSFEGQDPSTIPSPKCNCLPMPSHWQLGLQV